MKTDPLLNGRLERSRLLADYGLRGNRPIVLYAPTGARKNSLEIMGEDVIERLRATDRYRSKSSGENDNVSAMLSKP